VILTGLTPQTTYHYQASSTNGDSVSTAAPDATFTTASSPPASTPSANPAAAPEITLPAHRVSLSASTDPGSSIAYFQWIETTSNQAEIQSQCTPSTGVTDLSAVTTISLTVADRNGVAITKNVTITVKPSIHVSPAKTIVILGSSTAAGAGVSEKSRSWAGLFASYLEALNAGNSLVNLAVSGYTTADVVPTEDGGNPDHNITKALSLHPDGIIVSLPGNDVLDGVPRATTEENFEIITNAAAAEGVPIWVTSTLPRYGTANQIESLRQLRKWILTTFGARSIDLWPRLANDNGTPIPAYHSADNIHPNEAGHRIIYNRIVGSGFWESLFDAPTSASVDASTDSYEPDVSPAYTHGRK
jgi:lysophospholipase L1-like esterase